MYNDIWNRFINTLVDDGIAVCDESGRNIMESMGEGGGEIVKCGDYKNEARRPTRWTVVFWNIKTE